MTAQNYRQPFLSYVLNRTVTLKGSSILNDQDLQRFYGHKAVDSDNYLTNFVTEVYLHLIASKGMAKGMKVQVLRGNRVHTKNCNHFLRTFQGPPTRNVISQIIQKCTFSVNSIRILRLELFAPLTSNIFWFTCLKLIVNYCIKQKKL